MTAAPEPVIVLVRHGQPVIDAARPPRDWPLASVDACAELGELLPDLPVVTSDERKAIETAAALGRGYAVDGRLGEVKRPWVESRREFEEQTRRYLEGETIAGWEPRAEALARFSEAARGVVVSHGTIMTLFVASAADVDPFSFWSELRMPDAWQVAEGTVKRLRGIDRPTP